MGWLDLAELLGRKALHAIVCTFVVLMTALWFVNPDLEQRVGSAMFARFVNVICTERVRPIFEHLLPVVTSSPDTRHVPTRISCDVPDRRHSSEGRP